MFDRCRTIGLSIDGCSSDTYNTLRRGGSFEHLKKNLDFLKDIKSRHGFEVIFHCVVQAKNFMEMENYVHFAESRGADRIWFNRIVDWKTYTDFAEHDVVDPEHPLHTKFKEQLMKIKKYSYKDKKRFVEFPTLDNL